MAQLEVVCDFHYLRKVLLTALIVTMSTSTSSVHAISSEDEPCKREEGKRAYAGDNARVFSFKGISNEMEDTFAMEENIGELKVSLYGVFDGHGGNRAAKYTAEKLLVKMKRKLKEIRKNIRKGNRADYTNNGVINYEDFLKGEIKAFNDGDLLKELEEINDKSGTTAIIALITENKLYVANVGNSRAVLADINGNAIQISEDHEPNKKKEWKRITESPHGLLEPIEGIPKSKLLLINNETGKPQYTMISRSLGDRLLRNKEYGFIADADTFVEDFSKEKSRFIILATKGLWNVYENRKAVQHFLFTMLYPKYAAHAHVSPNRTLYSAYFTLSIPNLALSTRHLAMLAMDKGSKDNITIMVIRPFKADETCSEDKSRILESGERSHTSKNVTVFSLLGHRNDQMDHTFAIVENIGEPEVTLYGVFDGNRGDRAAKYTAKNLLVKMKTKLNEIRKHIEELDEADYTDNDVINYEDFLKGEIKAFNDGDLQKELEKNNDESRTTAIIALITNDTLYVANVGNSRAVMAEKAIHNSDHDEKEKPVHNIYDCTKGHEKPVTQWLGYDSTADAETFAKKFSQGMSKFVILATHGLWREFNDEEAVQFISDEIKADNRNYNEVNAFVAEKLAREAKKRGSDENITIMVITPE